MSKKDVLYALQSKDDPESASIVNSYLTSLYKGAAVEPSTASDGLELTSKVEKKYMAAQVVENGIQVGSHAACRQWGTARRCGVCGWMGLHIDCNLGVISQT